MNTDKESVLGQITSPERFSNWRTQQLKMPRARIPQYLRPSVFICGYLRHELTLHQLHIFWPDFEAFVLIFPDQGGIEFQKLWRQLASGFGEKHLRLLGRLFKRPVIIARAFALAVIPMCH